MILSFHCPWEHIDPVLLSQAAQRSLNPLWIQLSANTTDTIQQFLNWIYIFCVRPIISMTTVTTVRSQVVGNLEDHNHQVPFRVFSKCLETTAGAMLYVRREHPYTHNTLCCDQIASVIFQSLLSSNTQFSSRDLNSSSFSVHELVLVPPHSCLSAFPETPRTRSFTLFPSSLSISAHWEEGQHQEVGSAGCKGDCGGMKTWIN